MPLRRFQIAFGTTIYSFGRNPFFKREETGDFMLIFSWDRPKE